MGPGGMFGNFSGVSYSDNNNDYYSTAYKRQRGMFWDSNRYKFELDCFFYLAHFFTLFLYNLMYSKIWQVCSKNNKILENGQNQQCFIKPRVHEVYALLSVA